MSGNGNITVWINSPGGDCVAAAQIYNMLMDYPHDVTVKIDGIAASAASVIAMAGTKILMSPVSMLMPGFLFYPKGYEGGGHVRLCFSNISDADIERGVQILSEALEHSVE